MADDELPLVGCDLPALVEEGVYPATGVGRLRISNDGWTATQLWKLDGRDICIPQFFNLEPVKRGDKVVAASLKPRSKLMRELRRMGIRGRTDRLPTNTFTGRRVTIRVATVSCDWERTPLPRDEWYSKVLAIESLLDNEPTTEAE